MALNSSSSTNQMNGCNENNDDNKCNGSKIESPNKNHDKCAFIALRTIAQENERYFSNDETEPGLRIFEGLKAITFQITFLESLYDDVKAIAGDYDFDENTPGNGYRSFLLIVEKALLHCTNVCKTMQSKRTHVMFRKSHYSKEVESCSQLLASLCSCLASLKAISKWCNPGQLIPDDLHTPDELLDQGEINQYCFYGRCFGFQFCDSVKGILKLTAIFMAVFSEMYYTRGNILSKATTSMLVSGRYFLDPEIRAKRIVNLMQNASVEFCKAFWFLSESELMKVLPIMVSSSVAVNKLFMLPNKPILYVRPDSSKIEIPVATAHIGQVPLYTRLISSVYRKNMIGSDSLSSTIYQAEEPSRGLIFHCHGGGFVAQNSKSHEIYLREWAAHLKVPIFSIDYSLAPEAPYPRAQEELLYAYVWALENAASLGTTAERIIFAGDSAGANLSICLAMRCSELNIRPPDGLFLAYVPTKADFVPCPARLMCLLDPLLPFGFMMRCLKAYASPPSDVVKNNYKCVPVVANITTTENTENSFDEISESDVTDLYARKSQTGDISDDAATISNTVTPVSLNGDMHMYAEDLNKLVEEFDDSTIRDSDHSLKGKFTNFFNSVSNNFSHWISNVGINESDIEHDPEMIFNINENNLKYMEEFKEVNLKDPYLSPYWATDDMLRKLPPVRLVSTHFDPCLDDCVEFAKKLKKLGNDVDIKIMDGLPHGFLNLSMMSKDAYVASKHCAKLIADLLDLNDGVKDLNN